MGTKKTAQSLLDFLIDVMPELGDGNMKFLIKRKTVNDPKADKLYGLWNDSENKISERKFHRPPSMTEADIKDLEKAGFVEIHGKDIKVTNKGVGIIREMILNDDTSMFSKKSYAGTIKTAKLTNICNGFSCWYDRLKRNGK